MNNSFFGKALFSLMALLLALPSVAAEAVLYQEAAATASLSVNADVTASDIGASEAELNNASEEVTVSEEETGMLIEIGNTTAENTTIIIRPNDAEGDDEDQTIEIDASTSVLTDGGAAADLSDWIAGDQITYTVDHYTNSGAKVAKRLRNRSFKWNHRGKNGWIEAIRPEANEVDVTWNNNVYTLNTEEARMVVGKINPATLEDFEVGDRVRARVVDDGDGNTNTWDAQIFVALRRGDHLFMRVTRWVVDATVTMIPEDLTLPFTMEVEINPSKFFEEGDVNNLVGAPGETLMVDVYDTSNLRRRYLGKAFAVEFAEGDQVRIIGRRAEDTGHLVAKFIKNNSIQALGVANKLGRVTNVDLDNRKVEVNLVGTNRPWTIELGTDAVVSKDKSEVGLEGVKIDDVVRVRGTANRQTKKVQANKMHVLSVRARAPQMTDDTQ